MGLAVLIPYGGGSKQKPLFAMLTDFLFPILL